MLGIAGLSGNSLAADIAKISAIGGAADERHAELRRELVAHGRGAVTRDHQRNSIMSRLHHHLARESAGREQNLVLTIHAMQHHEARDGVDTVVPAHILDRRPELPALKQGAAMYGPRGAMNRVVPAHALENGEQIRLR